MSTRRSEKASAPDTAVALRLLPVAAPNCLVSSRLHPRKETHPAETLPQARSTHRLSKMCSNGFGREPAVRACLLGILGLLLRLLEPQAVAALVGALLSR